MVNGSLSTYGLHVSMQPMLTHAWLSLRLERARSYLKPVCAKPLDEAMIIITEAVHLEPSILILQFCQHNPSAITRGAAFRHNVEYNPSVAQANDIVNVYKCSEMKFGRPRAVCEQRTFYQ